MVTSWRGDGISYITFRVCCVVSQGAPPNRLEGDISSVVGPLPNTCEETPGGGVRAHVSICAKACKIFKSLEDDVSLWSLLWFLVPARFSDLPNVRGQPRSFKALGFLWPHPIRDLDHDAEVCESRKWSASCHQLKTKNIFQIDTLRLRGQTYRHNDHGQRVNVTLRRHLFLPGGQFAMLRGQVA